MVVPIVDVMGLAKSPALEEGAEHCTTSRAIKSARGSSVDNWKVAMLDAFQQVVDDANEANVMYGMKNKNRAALKKVAASVSPVSQK